MEKCKYMSEKDILDRQFGMRIARFLHRRAGRYIKRHYEELNKKNKEKLDKDWNDLFINDSKSLFQLNSNTLINLYKDSFLSRLIYDRSFEESELNFVRRFLKEDDVFFDIGANIGLFSLIASDLVGKKGEIYSFEPTPETFRRLTENIQSNAFENIRPIQLGLSDSQGDMFFNVSEGGYDAWNSFVKLDRLEENASTIKVKTDSLDSFIKDRNLASPISLIKIDVEGWELNVFKGAIELLVREDAPTLIVEFTETNAFAAGYYCGELYDYIKQFGYSWYRYDDINNTLIPEIKQLHYPYDNLIATKRLDEVKVRLLKK